MCSTNRMHIWRNGEVVFSIKNDIVENNLAIVDVCVSPELSNSKYNWCSCFLTPCASSWSNVARRSLRSNTGPSVSSLCGLIASMNCNRNFQSSGLPAAGLQNNFQIRKKLTGFRSLNFNYLQPKDVSETVIFSIRCIIACIVVGINSAPLRIVLVIKLNIVLDPKKIKYLQIMIIK